MTIDQPDTKNYDVQYSIRLPQDLLDEISKRAVLEGVKPSTWIRNSLMKLIQDKDEGNAGSIKPALMYLLTSDPEVQKQIQQIAGGARRKSEISKVENALSEYASLNNQEGDIGCEIGRLESETAKLQRKYAELAKLLEEIEVKRDILEKNFEKESGNDELTSVLNDYRVRKAHLCTEIAHTGDLIEKQTKDMRNLKILLSELRMRKADLFRRYNLGVDGQADKTERGLDEQ